MEWRLGRWGFHGFIEFKQECKYNGGGRVCLRPHVRRPLSVSGTRTQVLWTSGPVVPLLEPFLGQSLWFFLRDPLSRFALRKVSGLFPTSILFTIHLLYGWYKGIGALSEPVTFDSTGHLFLSSFPVWDRVCLDSGLRYPSLKQGKLERTFICLLLHWLYR